MSCSLANSDVWKYFPAYCPSPACYWLFPFWRIMFVSHNLKQQFRWWLENPKNYRYLASLLLSGLNVSLKGEQARLMALCLKFIWQHTSFNNWVGFQCIFFRQFHKLINMTFENSYLLFVLCSWSFLKTEWNKSLKREETTHPQPD